MKAQESQTPKIRPLVKEDAYAIGLLMEKIHSEFGCEPMHSLETTVRLFNTPWLENGTGFVIESAEAKILGYGWVRPSSWHCRNIIHLGLFLGTEAREEKVYVPLTNELLINAATRIAKHSGINEVITFYRSVDPIHPQIICRLGFKKHPVSMLGFRHNLSINNTDTTTVDINIRPAQLPQEKILITWLGEKIFDDPVNQGEPVSETYLDLEMMNPKFSPEQFLIAEKNGNPIGYLLMFLSKDTEEVCYDIGEFGVVPGWRKQGVGLTLLKTALNWIKKQGAQNAFVASFSSNPAISLYWKLKFRPDPVRTYYFYTKLI